VHGCGVGGVYAGAGFDRLLERVMFIYTMSDVLAFFAIVVFVVAFGIVWISEKLAKIKKRKKS
jgi:hypothetical protein